MNKKIQVVILLLIISLSVAIFGRSQLKFGNTQLAQVEPNFSFTPGITNSDITQENIAQNICNPSWSTKSIRPSVSYTNKLKAQQITQYSYTDTKMADYEEDHLISLELGGSPTDPKNLWPESYTTIPNARDKDKVENYLHKQVCSGALSLKEAQREISTDWISVYWKINPAQTLGSTSDE